jgi:hypothetical protein
MRQGRIILLLLTAIFLLTEVFFSYVVFTDGDGDVFGALSKTVIFLLFILLFSKKLTWAKWILSISLILYGLLCLLVGFELTAAFYFIGVFDIFFGFYIHKSKALAIFRKDNVEPHEISDTECLSLIKHTYIQDKRYKALLIDGLLILFMLVVIMFLAQDSDIRTPVMVSSALLLLLLYEPFLTSYSRTIGQRLMRIKVRSHKNPEKRITLLNAYIRWFVKGLLGWISFVTINFNTEHRAIHDLVSDSVMINEE